MVREWLAFLAYSAAARRCFWPFRRALSYFAFLVRKARFRVRAFFTARWSSASFGGRFAGSAVVYIAFAAILVVAVVAADLALVPHLYVPWGVPLYRIDKGIVVDIGIGVAQVLGGLLGLYFAAIGVVIGSAYSRVESDLRALSIRETVGNPYLRFLAATALYSVLLAAVVGAGYPGSRSGLVVLFVLASYAVVAFLELGAGVYRLFDPQLLSVRLMLDVVDSLKHVVVSSPYSLDRSFQTHYRKQVEAALSTWSALLSFVTAPPAPNLDASRDLLRDLLRLWVVYNEWKPQIPAESDWYLQRPRHENLLVANHMNLGVNLQTATMRPPKLERDHLWFDRLLATTISNGLSIHLRNGDADGVVTILQELQGQMASIARKLSTEEAAVMEEVASSAVIENLPTLLEDATATATPERLVASVAIADLVALAPIQVLLGPVQRLDTFPPTALDRDDWHRWVVERLFHRDVLPRPVLSRLEDIRGRLLFERSIEGRFVTPGWFLRQEYARALVEHVATAFERAASRIEAAYVPRIKKLEAVLNSRAALHVALRGREACNKIAAHAETVAAWCRRMQGMHIHGAAGAEVDVAAYAKRVAALDTALLREIARLAPAVYEEQLPADGLLPDYFGDAYIRLSDALFWRMAEGADAHFEELFNAVGRLSLLAFNRVRKDVPPEWAEHAIVRYRAPLANLLELSGMAYVFTQLGGPNFWAPVRVAWERSMFPAIPAALMKAVIADDSSVAMDPWFATWFNWRKEAVRRIATVVETQGWISPFIRQFVRSFSWRTAMREVSGADVFIAVYLRHYHAFAGLELPSSAESLVRGLHREMDHAEEEEEIPFV